MVGIFSLALVAVSCNKADDGYFPEEAFSAQEAELKKGKAVKPGNQTIAEIVVASTEADPSEFTLLLAALEYAGLTDVFTGGGQYTVFAPTDEAFLNLVAFLGPQLDPDVLENDGAFAAIDTLLGEGTIANVLLYHVAEGRRAANSVVPPVKDRKITTLLEGATFAVSKDGVIFDTYGQEATILEANISASNGIIHKIDTVILPLEQ
jgi:transforming growth factor-beta-induced protein